MGKLNILLAFLFIAGGVVLLVVVGFAAMDEFSRTKKIEAEIQALRDEASQIAKENEELERNVEYFRTQAYKERQAKDKLDFRKPGERAIVVTGLEEENSELSLENSEQPEESLQEIPNYKQWWNVFFPNT